MSNTRCCVAASCALRPSPGTVVTREGIQDQRAPSREATSNICRSLEAVSECPSPIDAVLDTETGSTEVESPATEVSEIHLVGESFEESSNALEEPIEPSPGPENCPMDLDVGSPKNISVAPSRPIEQPPTTGVFKRRLVGDSPMEILPVLTKCIDSKWSEPSLHPRVFPVYLIVRLPRDTLTYRQSTLVFSGV
jgi:hypothetical protein